MQKQNFEIQKRKNRKNKPNSAMLTLKYTNKQQNLSRQTYSGLQSKINYTKQFNKRTNYKLKELLAMWFSCTRISVKGATAYKYEYLIEKHINPRLGEFKISDITAETLSLFAEEKLKNGSLTGKGGLSSEYVKSMLNIIKAAIEFGAQNNLCIPIISKISKPISKKSELCVLNASQQIQLKSYIDKKMSLTGLGILISLYAGLRIGEICALSWDDIDFETKIIHIRHTVSRVKTDPGAKDASKLILDTPKTRSSQRDIPISSVLMPYLIHAKENSVSSFVVSDKPQFISTRTFEYRYHKIMTDCSLVHINYHALRHTFATRCIEAGVDVKSLSEILGHANVSITLNIYVHSSMELKRAQLEKLSTHTDFQNNTKKII